MISDPVISDTLHKLEAGRDLSRAEAETLMEELLAGRMAQPDVVRFLLAMRTKGETVEELVGFAQVMRRHATPVAVGSAGDGTAGASLEEWPLVDTCGTGGDSGRTFNVSTAAALVVAGAGVRVAKHGNRSISSRCGSADVLEALGLKLDMPAERVGEAIARIGIGFLFAPAMHTAMKHAMSARREVGGRTVFNLLGPLTNPAGASAQVIGVPAPSLVEKVGRALAELGAKRAFVVHGVDGIDEISLSDETEVAEVKGIGQRIRQLRESRGMTQSQLQARSRVSRSYLSRIESDQMTPSLGTLEKISEALGDVNSYRIAPEDFGVARSPREPLAGGDAATNAQIIRRILEGERGPRRDFVCINAGAALVAAGRAADFKEGARMAAEAIDSGAALAKLDALIAFSRA